MSRVAYFQNVKLLMHLIRSGVKKYILILSHSSRILLQELKELKIRGWGRGGGVEEAYASGIGAAMTEALELKATRGNLQRLGLAEALR